MLRIGGKLKFVLPKRPTADAGKVVPGVADERNADRTKRNAIEGVRCVKQTRQKVKMILTLNKIALEMLETVASYIGGPDRRMNPRPAAPHKAHAIARMAAQTSTTVTPKYSHVIRIPLCAS